jgi:hypothetical protein
MTRTALPLAATLLAAACTNLPAGPLDLVQANVVQDDCELFDGTGTEASPRDWSYAPEFLDPNYDEALTGIDPSGQIVLGLDPEQGNYIYTGQSQAPAPCLRLDGADGSWTDADFGVEDGTVGETLWSQFAVKDGSTLLLALEYSYDGSDDRCDAPPAWGPVDMPAGGCATTVLLTLEW